MMSLPNSENPAYSAAPRPRAAPMNRVNFNQPAPTSVTDYLQPAQVYMHGYNMPLPVHSSDPMLQHLQYQHFIQQHSPQQQPQQQQQPIRIAPPEHHQQQPLQLKLQHNSEDFDDYGGSDEAEDHPQSQQQMSDDNKLIRSSLSELFPLLGTSDLAKKAEEWSEDGDDKEDEGETFVDEKLIILLHELKSATLQPNQLVRANLAKGVTDEQVAETRKYLHEHSLMPVISTLAIEVLEKDRAASSATTTTATTQQGQEPVDYALDTFLLSQGINFNEPPKNSQAEEFYDKLRTIKEGYEQELKNLDAVYTKFCEGLAALLKDQSVARMVTERERDDKIASLKQRFNYLRTQLRQNVCNVVAALQKHHNQVKRKRRSLNRRATDILNKWFFSHLNDPYPSDEEKMVLAGQCALTLSQVNNWFGNKRIRYKRKCLEEEAKKSHGGGGRKSKNATPATQHPHTPGATTTTTAMASIPTDYSHTQLGAEEEEAASYLAQEHLLYAQQQHAQQQYLSQQQHMLQQPQPQQQQHSPPKRGRKKRARADTAGTTTTAAPEGRGRGRRRRKTGNEEEQQQQQQQQHSQQEENEEVEEEEDEHMGDSHHPQQHMQQQHQHQQMQMPPGGYYDYYAYQGL